MKKLPLVLLAIVSLFVLAGCRGDKQYDDLLQQADSIMNIDDDSAKVAIQLLDKVKPQLNDFSKAQRMRYQLLYHKAMNKADISFSSDSIMKNVVAYYEKHGTSNERMLAYYMLGCVYRDIHEAPLALEYYNKATEQADTTSQDCDYATLCRIYGQMGILFEKQFLPYQELGALDKAVKYAYFAKDTLNALRYYQNKNSAYDFLGKKDSAMIINLKATNLFRKHGYDYDANIAFGCNYIYYIDNKNYPKAKEAFEAYQSTNYQGNTNYDDSKAFLLYEKGLYYMFMNNLNIAYTCLQQSLKLSKSYSNKCAATKGLAKYYTKTNHSALAAEYALLSSEYNDSSLYELRESQLQQMQAMYDYSRNQKLAKEAEYKAKQRLNTIYLIIISSCLILLSAVYIYRKNIRKRNHKLLVAQRLYKASILKLQTTKTELAHLKNLNETKIAALIKEKEAVIENLQKEINQYESIHSGRNLVEINKQLMDTFVYKKLAYIECHPQEKITDETWDNLEKTLEGMIPSLANIKLKLSKKEYRICLLTRLHFSPSAISCFMQCNLPDISMSRKRMLSKLCEKDGKPKELDEYIQHLM
ncbi:MAG: hypothetical protein UFD09_04345 [Prevotella sp.]|nr:hypothetical protein [Prevotella sp.]